MISEQEFLSPVDESQGQTGKSFQAEIEQVAAKIVHYLPRVSVDKLEDQLASKVPRDGQAFDPNHIHDSLEIASDIVILSNSKHAQEIAADVRVLGKDYAEHLQVKWGNQYFLGPLGPRLLLELQKRKLKVRGGSYRKRLGTTGNVLRGWFDKFFLWAFSKFFGISLALFLSFPKRQRMSHNNGIAARGTFKVVSRPTFPPHPFFAPKQEFPLRIRHASATFLDDAMNCIRSISLKLADSQFKSPFDLEMNTGETSLFWSAASFWNFALMRKEKYGIEYPEYYRNYPDGLEGSKIATRRHTEFQRLYYYCKTPFLYNSSDGKKYYAKYRVVPLDPNAEDDGIATDRSDWEQCNQRVKNHDKHGRNDLKYKYADLVAKEGKVSYRLQIQTRLASDAKTDPELCNNMVVWNEEWHDLGVMEITETLDWRESTLTSFSLNNMPKSLGVIPATSVYDYNSLNYMRSHAEIAYKARKLSYLVFGMVPPIPDNENRNVSEWGE